MFADPRALFSGRNQHEIGFGNLQNAPAGYPGYNTVWHKETARVAEILKLNGYSTAAFGKWHNTPIWEISPAGPFDHWPTGLGFEYFYGFLYAAVSQWEPKIVSRHDACGPPAKRKGYHLTTDLVNDARPGCDSMTPWPRKSRSSCTWRQAQRTAASCAEEWIDRQKGQFDEGGTSCARNIRPPEGDWRDTRQCGTNSAPKRVPAWESLPAAEEALRPANGSVRGLSVPNRFEVGRLLQGLKDEGKSENTLVLYVVGDNGGSAEGGLEGSENNFATLAGAKQRGSLRC